MKKLALLIVLSLGIFIFGCVHRQTAQPSEPEQTPPVDRTPPDAAGRVTVSVDERPNGDIVTVTFYEDDVPFLSYEYYGGGTCSELGEMNGSLLRAMVTILQGGAVAILYFDNSNVIQGLAAITEEGVGGQLECSQSEEATAICVELQTEWNGAYVNLRIAELVRQGLER